MDDKRYSARAEESNRITRQLSFDSARMKEIGSRFTPEGSTTEYGRDMDRLYAQYKPLRLAIYKRVASRLYNQEDKNDLSSYLNEHFIRLCLEFDLTNEMDFPGFIKTLLTFRASNSFISGLTRVYGKADASGLADELEEKMGTPEETGDSEEAVLAYYDSFVAFVYKNYHLSEVESTIFEGILFNERTLEMARGLRRDFDVPQSEGLKQIAEFRERLLGYLNEFNEVE